MKQIILIVTLIGLISLVSADYACTTQSYDQFRKDFEKNQDLAPELYQLKFNKFCWTLQNIVSLNGNGATSSHKITQFADFLESDNKKLLNAQRPLGNGESAASYANVGANLERTGGTPPNWKSKASRIKNQGTCGACWAFTSTGLYETLMIVKGKPQYDLSEEFILQCTNTLHPTTYNSDCTGGYTDFALQVVKSYGIPNQTAWPYRASTFGSVAGTPTTTGICSTAQNFIKYNTTMGAKSDVNLTRYDNVTVTQMQNLLVDGPVGALMYVDQSFQSYSSGVYTSCPNFANAFASINHAVVIVGMDANNNYIIKNSWGTAWGDSGFATVSSVNDCALSAYVFKLSWGYQLLGSSFIFFLALLVFVF